MAGRVRILSLTLWLMALAYAYLRVPQRWAVGPGGRRQGLAFATRHGCPHRDLPLSQGAAAAVL